MNPPATLTTEQVGPAADGASLTTRPGRWIDNWDPEDNQQWTSRGSRVAKGGGNFASSMANISFFFPGPPPGPKLTNQPAATDATASPTDVVRVKGGLDVVVMGVSAAAPESTGQRRIALSDPSGHRFVEVVVADGGCARGWGRPGSCRSSSSAATGSMSADTRSR